MRGDHADSRPRLSVREGLHKIASSEETIVALSTPVGRSGIGIVRVSGSAAESIGRQFFRSSSELRHRQAAVGRWETPEGEVVDEVVVVLYRHPHSYTGEDVFEISAHGNPLVLNRIIRMIQSAGARTATPGEFTLRAVAHGKMDLIQAEAVREFIEAQTDGQARIALRQIDGAVSRRVSPLKHRLVNLIAHLEAGIDFAEDDVELPDARRSAGELFEIRTNLDELQRTYSYGRLLNAGVRIVIAGRPNVGKSSLFNRLVLMDRAIVTEIPGTTRDVLSESSDLNGIPVRFFDTAGVRDTVDRVERLGVSRTLETLAEADLVLLVIDGASTLSEEDRGIRERINGLPHLIVANKRDIASDVDPAIEKLEPIWISAQTGEGLENLQASIAQILGGDRAQSFGESILTTARQNEAVSSAIVSLAAGERALRDGIPHEMALLDIYQGLSYLNELTGETTTDDILGRIFSTFCVGK
jgi:tRNA modification GTPase